MKFSYLVSLVSAYTLSMLSVVADGIPDPLSEAEATAIIEAQMSAKAVKEQERKERILAVDSGNEKLITSGKKKILLRRVESRFLEVAELSPENLTTEVPAPFVELLENHEFVNISLSATVYDDEYTQITWRDENGAPIILWVNLNFKYLSPINSYELDSVHYSYFGLTNEVDTEAFITHPGTGEKIYPHSLPEWMPTAEDFPSEPAYLVLSEEGEEIPDALYQQIDALLIYYIGKEEELKAAYQRAEALKKAKSDFLQLNPQSEKQVIINYWPINSNSEL